MDRRGVELTSLAIHTASIVCAAPMQIITEPMVYVQTLTGHFYGERAVPIRRGQVQAASIFASVA